MATYVKMVLRAARAHPLVRVLNDISEGPGIIDDVSLRGGPGGRFTPIDDVGWGAKTVVRNHVHHVVLGEFRALSRSPGFHLALLPR